MTWVCTFHQGRLLLITYPTFHLSFFARNNSITPYLGCFGEWNFVSGADGSRILQKFHLIEKLKNTNQDNQINCSKMKKRVHIFVYFFRSEFWQISRRQNSKAIWFLCSNFLEQTALTSFFLVGKYVRSLYTLYLCERQHNFSQLARGRFSLVTDFLIDGRRIGQFRETRNTSG